MSAARLPAAKDLDAFVFDDTPINEGLVRSPYSSSFLPGRRNVVPVGGTGTGKTHLATAITANVVRADARGRYFNRLDLVVLDELGYLPFARSGGHLIFHLVSKLYEQTSVIAPRTSPLANGRPSLATPNDHRAARPHYPTIATSSKRATTTGDSGTATDARDTRRRTLRAGRRRGLLHADRGGALITRNAMAKNNITYRFA